MALFFQDTDRRAVEAGRAVEPYATFSWALLNRVERRAASPGLVGRTNTVEWWHHAADYLSDAAMARELHSKFSPAAHAWLRDVSLSIARRPIRDWIGPAFRDHTSHPPSGHLETAHLSWGLSVVLDLAPDLFSDIEREEMAAALREKGMALCRRWLERDDHLANWHCVLNAGVAVPAAVLGDSESLALCAQRFLLCQDMFQPDGSHGESLQYANYAAHAQMLVWEALVRHAPERAAAFPLAPYVHMPRWQAASFFYRKPLSGWGAHPRPRSANFNDSAALFRPSADLLLHIATRGRDSHPKEAGLARWLFDTLYCPHINQGPDDLSSFGFVNEFGFLTPALLVQAAPALAPHEAGLGDCVGFGCGDMFARDSHLGRTILAVRGGGDPLHGPGHLHGDLNSFILVHNRERLLADPGHSCYRNLIRELDTESQTHNTCTFRIEDRLLQQGAQCRRRVDPRSGQASPPVDRGGRRLILAADGRLTVLGSEAAALYGTPLVEFSRFWFLCGSHALFVVDRIRASEPVRTIWNWLLNNRDDGLEMKLLPPDRLIARRGEAGMKFFHLGKGCLRGPIHAHVHDAYHPLPHQRGEGAPGSGVLLRWEETEPALARTCMHAICMDSYGRISRWHLRQQEGCAAILEGPDGSERWELRHDEGTGSFEIEECVSQTRHRVARDANQTWSLLPASPRPL